MRPLWIMALAKKGTRSITVDGCQYRWQVRRRPTRSQDYASDCLRVGVESVHSGGSVLVIEMPHGHPSACLNYGVVAVTPSVIAAAIRKAVSAGWQPGQPGGAYVLSLKTLRCQLGR